MRKRPEMEIAGFCFRCMESKITIVSGGIQQAWAMLVRIQKMTWKGKNTVLMVVGIIKEKSSQ